MKLRSVLILLISLPLFTACESPTPDALLNPGAENANFSDLAKKGSPPSGHSLVFDGVDDFVIVPDDPSLDLTTGFTIAAWIYFDSYVEWASIVTKGGVVGDGGATTPNNYTIHQSGPQGGSDFGYLRFTGSPPSLPLFLESNTKLALNTWHFVAITWNGSHLQFYLNGNPDGGGSLGGPLTPNADPLHIGLDLPGADEYWDGKMDEVRIWNRALSAAHVRAAMNGHAAPRASALVGYWRFDEGSGTFAGDRSRENNHGTIHGSAAHMPQ